MGKFSLHRLWHEDSVVGETVSFVVFTMESLYSCLVIELILIPLTFQRSLYSLHRPLKASRSYLHCKNVSNWISLYKLSLISPVLISTGLSAPVPRGRKGKKVKTQTSSFDIQKAEWLRKYNPEQLLQDEGYKKHIKHHCNK